MDSILFLLLNIPNKIRKVFRTSHAPSSSMGNLFRFALIIILPFIFAWVGGKLFESLNIVAIVNPHQEEATVKLFNLKSFRYIIAPIIATYFIITASALFVQDIYNFKLFSPALQFIFATFFGMFYPGLRIDKGQKVLSKGKIHILDDIGGPGYVQVQPGHAIFLTYASKPSRVIINHDAFLRPFEMIGGIANLDDQHGYIDQLETMTSEGIKIRLKDIHYRFRSITEKDAPPDIDDPYPHSIDALSRRVANMPINADGLVPWQLSVKLSISSAIKKYVNSHTVDFLTAPRDEDFDPRHDFRAHIMKKSGLWPSGTALLWIDAGHFDIFEEDVNKERVNLWAADWIGKTEARRAYSLGKRQAIEGIGRSQARADLINGISHALEGIDMTGDTTENLRRLFLSRTAILLETMGNSQSNSDTIKGKPPGSKNGLK